MIKRCNFTGRQSILHNTLRLRLTPDRHVEGHWTLDSSFPASACIVVEAFSSGLLSVQRLAFGTVGTPLRISQDAIPDDLGDSVAFNFKVIDESNAVGRLLGLAENIRPSGPGDASTGGLQSLLPVNPTDLRDEVWKVSFQNGRPWLEVNNRIDGIMNLAQKDGRFFALVYPSVIRSVFTQILVIEQFTDPDADSSDWKVQWLQWGVHWHPDKERPAEGEREEQLRSWLEWIEAVCNSFCGRHEVRHQFESASSTGVTQ